MVRRDLGVVRRRSPRGQNAIWVWSGGGLLVVRRDLAVVRRDLGVVRKIGALCRTGHAGGRTGHRPLKDRAPVVRKIAAALGPSQT